MTTAPLGELLCDKAFKNDPSTGNIENFKLAIMWLSQCLSCHELCALSTDPFPPLPSRILDVRAEESPDHLRLCSGEGRHGPYVTLSHVWGKVRVITTTLSTIKARMNAIETDSLPRTFQDAVIVAREMNIRYLWIDSLCIIQDSINDWTKESSKMGEYYMNSLFNISAVSASDSSVGCFMARNPRHTTPCKINFCFPGIIPAKSETLFLRSSSGWDPVNRIAEFQRPPLWQRAWVVQERLLSARLLQFSSMQVSWKCRTMIASENIPEGIQDTYMSEGDRILRQALVGLKKFRLDTNISGDEIVREPGSPYGTADELIDLYNAWYDLVSLYGKCSLTIESDIFQAISGIAKAVATATGDRYVAGLWEYDLHRGLLWSAPDSTSSKPELRKYRAPSWSWASLCATCTFYVREISQVGLRVDKGHFRINAITGLSSDINPYGQISRAELKASGLLKQAHPIGCEEVTFKAIADDCDKHSLFDLEEKRIVGFYFADNMNKSLLTEIWCCPVMTEEEITSDSITGSVVRRPFCRVEARCLALVTISRAESIYMRVGSAWITDFSWFNNCKPCCFSII